MLTNLDLFDPFQDENITLFWRREPLLVTFCEHCDSVAHRVCSWIIRARVGRIRQVDALRQLWIVYINFVFQRSTGNKSEYL